MSETGTRDAIARAFAAFNASDLDGLTSCFTEDVAHDMPGGGREIGRDRLRWRLAEMARHFRAEAADIAIMTAPGGFRAAAEFTLRGTYLATLEGFPAARGQAFRLSAGVFLDVEDDGLISRITVCCDRARLAAALAG